MFRTESFLQLLNTSPVHSYLHDLVLRIQLKMMLQIKGWVGYYVFSVKGLWLINQWADTKKQLGLQPTMLHQLVHHIRHDSTSEQNMSFSTKLSALLMSCFVVCFAFMGCVSPFINGTILHPLNQLLLIVHLPLNDDHRTHCYNYNNTCLLWSYPWFSSSHRHDKESSPLSLLMDFWRLMVSHLWSLLSLICNKMEVA